ncbi:hypothetical protein [Nisaea sp.]|uniref:hypothetical protein n=1 Tax=Nisaea sp. TaxID=2024842 RepID=UPI0032631C3C
MPAPSNAIRATWAANALNTFTRETFLGHSVADFIATHKQGEESDLGDAITNLMCDLLHLTDAHGIDGNELSKRALEQHSEQVFLEWHKTEIEEGGV